MKQFNDQGNVIPHYYGENYRGYDIYKSYHNSKAGYVPHWVARNPYDDCNATDENLLNAPLHFTFNSLQEAKDWLDRYTFLAQPDMDETARLCSSRWDADNKFLFAL